MGGRVARVVTEVLAPANLAALTFFLVALRATDTPWRGLGWGALAVVCCVGAPYGVVLAGVRARRWSDHHLRVRAQRILPLGLGLACSVVGWFVLRARGAPVDLLALVLASAAGLGSCLAATTMWKMSIHAGVAAGSAVVVAIVSGPSTIVVCAPLVVVTAWSRVRLGEHTKAQVVVGGLVGAVVAGTVFPLARGA
ncbi:MAG: hypothetical protein ACRYF3_16985 [Janthinobacterium lividum]